MSVLSDAEILKRMAWPMAQGGLRISPWVKEQLAPNSYDLLLGPHLLLYRDDMASVHEQVPAEVDLDQAGEFRLRPGDFALCTTVETLHLGNGIAARIAGKSSRAREGLSIEAAGWVDAGWVGQITLEMVAHRPVTLYPGMKIGQAVFLDAYPSTHTYEVKGHYQGQVGATESWEVDR